MADKDLGLTLQQHIKQYNDANNNIKNYSLFLGGLNATSKSLMQYDPLKTGYNRIFFVKMPEFMQTMYPNMTSRIKHIMEYGFTSIQGLGNVSLEFEQMTGGYAGRQLEVGSVSRDETNEITLSTYEFAGSPIREYMDLWISGIADPYTGLGHYHGAMDKGVKYAHQNHVAEAIYVATDPTGRHDGIEYCCLLTNMMPKQVKKDQFNYESGRHELVTVDTSFTCVKYESPQINELGVALMKKYQVLRDYLEFKTEYTPDDNDATGVAKGEVPSFKNWTPANA
jgi:hypothetical protein